MPQSTEFYPLARLHARGGLRAKGYRLLQINHLIAGADDDVIDLAVAQAGATPPVQASAKEKIGPALTATGSIFGGTVNPNPGCSVSVSIPGMNLPSNAISVGSGGLAAFIAAIEAFFESPAGQSVEAALISLLLKAIGG